ncbi:MAG: hypothetical protein JW801_02265 [Bacteroidales bacterium]|nr:hypothetical protein [Bacteroidales bacterium]
MKILKALFILSLLAFTAKSYGQYLPPSYQPMLDEMVENFKTIRGSNSITKGKNTLSVVNDDKIALRIEHNKSVKNLTFITQPDEENKLFWMAANELTIDMVNKYEKDLTKILEDMLKLSRKKSQE